MSGSAEAEGATASESGPAATMDRTAPGGLAPQLVRLLAESIRSGGLHPGDRLPTEGTLAQDYGVSRTVVREAMSRLSAQGLVETQQGRGSFVLAVPSMVPFAVDGSGARTPAELGELLELRLGFETEAAGLAAHRADARRLASIATALETFESEIDSPGASVAADFGFHRSIALASGNRYFVQLLDSLGRTAIAAPIQRMSMTTGSGSSAHLRVVAVEHENIHRAIARRSAEDARAAMRVHLANSQERLSAVRPRTGS